MEVRPDTAARFRLPAAAGRHDRLLLFDVECIPAPGWLAGFVQHLDAGLVTSTVRYLPRPTLRDPTPEKPADCRVEN